MHKNETMPFYFPVLPFSGYMSGTVSLVTLSSSYFLFGLSMLVSIKT